MYYSKRRGFRPGSFFCTRLHLYSTFICTESPVSWAPSTFERIHCVLHSPVSPITLPVATQYCHTCRRLTATRSYIVVHTSVLTTPWLLLTMP